MKSIGESHQCNTEPKKHCIWKRKHTTGSHLYKGQKQKLSVTSQNSGFPGECMGGDWKWVQGTGGREWGAFRDMVMFYFFILAFITWVVHLHLWFVHFYVCMLYFNKKFMFKILMVPRGFKTLTPIGKWKCWWLKQFQKWQNRLGSA